MLQFSGYCQQSFSATFKKKFAFSESVLIFARRTLHARLLEIFLAPVVAILFGVRLPGVEPAERNHAFVSSSH
jgi:hypothetical protein